MSYEHLLEVLKGGPTSGNWGHAGRVGKRGGSAPKSGLGAAMSLRTGRDAAERQSKKKISALYDNYKRDADTALDAASSAINKMQKRSTFTGNTAAYGTHMSIADEALRKAKIAVVQKLPINELNDDQFKDYQRIGRRYNKLLDNFYKKQDS